MDVPMPNEAPDALDLFIDAQVKAGAFASREAALADIRQRIAVGLDQFNRGEVLDGEEVFRELLEDVKHGDGGRRD